MLIACLFRVFCFFFFAGGQTNPTSLGENGLVRKMQYSSQQFFLLEKQNRPKKNNQQTRAFQRMSIGYSFVLVIPTGLEPISKEPESFILSIELGDLPFFCEDKNSKT